MEIVFLEAKKKLVKEISKNFGEFKAIDQLSFNV